MPLYTLDPRQLVRIKKDQRERLIKRSVLAIAVIEPAMTIPQIYEIWSSKQAAGVSSTTWGLYIIAAIVWLLYGMQIKDKPLVISSVLWIITEVAVLIGTFMYS